MDRRAIFLLWFVAAGCFQLIENPWHHIQRRSQDEIPGHQFYRRSLGALAKADKTLGDNVDMTFADTPFDGFGDGQAATRRTRRLITLEAPVHADQYFRRAFIQTNHLLTF